MTQIRPRTRIQQRNRALILEAALEVFAAHGFRGATVDQIARAAGLSKPNLLYYFPSKEAIHRSLLSGLMDTWLAPLRQLDPEGEPIEEIVGYVMLKLDMARKFPRESRLFANEILQGAPRIMDQIDGELRELVEEKCAVIRGWQEAGRIKALSPEHLIFSIWATTQHYADFDTQVRGILRPRRDEHFEVAADFLSALFRGALAPDGAEAAATGAD